jgi:hypothetical protein
MLAGLAGLVLLAAGAAAPRSKAGTPSGFSAGGVAGRAVVPAGGSQPAGAVPVAHSGLLPAYVPAGLVLCVAVAVLLMTVAAAVRRRRAAAATLAAARTVAGGKPAGRPTSGTGWTPDEAVQAAGELGMAILRESGVEPTGTGLRG